ncbi:ubiquitin-binding ESCRT-I subunit protein STP22 [Apiospora phragmitis]|uniref:Ubiquitin-binding ESCRT-I subunit protein STP22 n=1 Tax=Apiospora phragmitis TaxID=2905665 RepID=A0ABR1W1N2_9PEZI
MAVQQHVLNWLYSVLTSEYHNVNRTYNDVAQALSVYPSLSPRTDVHTFDNGVSALLVHLTGTIPVVFRGTTYRFPISIWVPHAYPREAPLAYVTPTESMMVRPGQHVDPQGRIYHPYLVGWIEFWDDMQKSSILDFLAILRDVFAKEPPVIARQQQPRPPQPEQSTAMPPPPIPPLPAELSRTPVHRQPPAVGDRPPPPPPKGSDAPQVVPGQAINAADGPPLPPLPHEARHPQSQYGAQHPQSDRMSRYDSAPPLPPQQQQQQPPPQTYNQAPGQQFHPQQPASYQQPAPQPGYQGPPPPPPDPGLAPMSPNHHDGTQAPYNGHPPNWQPPHPQQPMHQPPIQPKPKPPPPPDIMDEPLTLALPSPSNIPPPPIPPNPEKDALLRQLAATLHTLRQRARQQNESSLAGLTAQRNAMLAAAQNLQADASNLAPLSALLSSNTAVLQSSLCEADRVVAHARTQTPPGIDELLVAPTVVGNQLYDVVAEERALGDAIFMLGRAVERGRVAPPVFAKTVRSLAREQYLKKALARKIGKGMGLATA